MYELFDAKKSQTRRAVRRFELLSNLVDEIVEYRKFSLRALKISIPISVLNKWYQLFSAHWGLGLKLPHWLSLSKRHQKTARSHYQAIQPHCLAIIGRVTATQLACINLFCICEVIFLISDCQACIGLSQIECWQLCQQQAFLLSWSKLYRREHVKFTKY